MTVKTTKLQKKMKICNTCKKVKPVSEFCKRYTSKDGLNYSCRSCISNHYFSKREYYQNKGKEWKKNNKEKLVEYNKKLYEKNKDAYRGSRFKKIYGITLEKYKQMEENQKGCCYICGKTKKENGRELSVDHCHNNKKVRALLCDNCNTCLGRVNDNIALLKKMIKYLIKFKDRVNYEIREPQQNKNGRQSKGKETGQGV